MLPDGFRWDTRHTDPDELDLRLHGRQVAMLLRRNDGRWFARLEAHWPVTEPVVSRPCTSRTSGKRGIEAWAARHRERLEREVGKMGGLRVMD